MMKPNLTDLHPPKTDSEAADRALLVLSDDQKAEILTMQEEHLIDLHFGLGMAISTLILMGDWNALVTCANHQMRRRVRMISTYYDKTRERERERERQTQNSKHIN